MKKVLHLYKNYYPVNGGIQQAMKSVIDSTPEYDHRILVTSEEGAGEYIYDGVKVISCKSYGNFLSTPISPSYMIKAISMSKESDMVCLHYPFPLNEFALMFTRVKSLVYFWHSDIVSQKKSKLLAYPFVKKMLKKAEKIFISYPDMAKNSDILYQFEDKTVVCPYAVSQAEPVQEAAGRAKNFGKYILSVGRLVPYKGFKYLIEAMKGIDELNLVICGTGPLKDELSKQIKSCGLSRRVFLLEDVSDEELKELHSMCEFYVFPSCMKSEAFGIAMLEAMSYGKAIVNTQLDTGVNWVARDGIEAITVPPCDVQALMDAVKQIYIDIEIKNKLCDNSRLRAESMFNPERRQEILRSVFKEIFSKTEK